MSERRAIPVRPHAAAVRRDDQQPPVVFQHAPGFTQQPAGVLGVLQAMHQQDAVERQVGERQQVFLGGA